MRVYIPRFLGHWLSTALALWATDLALRGVWLDSLEALALGSFALAAVNAIVRPVLTLLTLPITVLTLGLFLLVVNGACFELAAALVSGFHVSTFLAAMVGALLTSLGAGFVEWLFRDRAAAPPRPAQVAA
jgi:putative membrane protein